MHKPPLSTLVYNALFPKPRSNDPTNFASHTNRHLVPEVRIETSTFYGTLDCIEAQYPGLDYTFPPHRMRLSRFYHHRKLFRVFDELRLTPSEIRSLCRWEGTKSARDRYEEDESVEVRDTTADGISSAVPLSFPSVHIHTRDGENDVILSRGRDRALPTENIANPRSEIALQRDDTTDEDSSDDDLESVGFALNQHLLEATAAREQGANVSLDDVWEQWLKDAIERGSYEDILQTIRHGSTDFSREPPSTALLGNPDSIRSVSARHRMVTIPNSARASVPSMLIPDQSTGSSSNAAARTA